MSRNLNSRNPLKNISQNPPSRKIVGAGGVMITEKRCPIPFNRKMVSPAGDVITLALANGFTIRSFKGNDYGVQILEDKLKAGFIPFNECPVAKGRDIGPTETAACKGSDGRGQFSDDTCCPHVTAVILARKEAHRQAQTEYGRNFATNQDRLIALMEANAERDAKAERQVTRKGGPGSG